MTQMRTSWNSSSKELGPSTESGTAVPPTLPVAPTWGSKFPISRDPALFLLLPSKPKGPTLENCGVGWEALNTLQIGSEKGEILSPLTFYFKFCLFIFKYRLWVCLGFGFFGGFFVCFLFFFLKGNEMEFEQIVSLISVLPVLCGARPRASTDCGTDSQCTWCCPRAPLCLPREAATERKTGCSNWYSLASFSPSGDSPAPRTFYTSSSHRS